MESSPSLDPFNLTKIQSSPSDQNPKLVSRTPVKAENPPRRRLMSVKEVREAAEKLRSPGPKRVVRSETDDSDWVRFGSGKYSRRKSEKKKKSIELPDKYELLCKFFYNLEFLLRLLRLKGKMPSLKNLSPQIEFLTNRRFSIVHLAQLKYILPEAIVLKKVLEYDEKTFCMKPDIHVTLNVGAIKSRREQKNVIGRPDVKKAIRSRLLDFVKAHPEEEVPEGPLPEPFNRSQINLDISSRATSSTLLNDTLTSPIEQHATSASHLSQTFRPRFSKQVSSQSTSDPQASVPFSCLPVTPIKITNIVKNKVERNCTIEKKPGKVTSTPGKVTSTPEKLMSVTPALAPPKRCYMTPEDDLTTLPLVRRPVRRRSLKFDTPVKRAEVTKNEVEIYVGDLSSDDDIFEILPKSLVQSIREKEMKLQEENDPAISKANRREKMIANLPQLFDTISYCFQSSKHSLISKEELLHKLMTTHLDIIDRKEVEDQLVFLKELVPDLIYEKLTSSGDLLLGINKLHSPEFIRARLVEAKLQTSNQIEV